MGDKTGIQWCDATWSPIRARVKADAAAIAQARGWLDLIDTCRKMAGCVGPHCEMISPGCVHCYSAGNNHRCLPANGTGLPFDKRARELVDVFIDDRILEQPLHWKRPRRIFVENQSDLFGEWVPFEMIDRVFAVMALAQQHVFQVLTKRPRRLAEYLQDGPRPMWSYWIAKTTLNDGRPNTVEKIRRAFDVQADIQVGKTYPIGNIWLGVSVENQDTLERIDVLKDVPAAIRFVSFEPLLEDLGALILDGIQWAIFGGESGPKARPLNIDWIRHGVGDCRAYQVPPFVKQLGAHVEACDIIDAADYFPGAVRLSKGSLQHCARVHLKDSHGGNPEEWPAELRLREFPK